MRPHLVTRGAVRCGAVRCGAVRGAGRGGAGRCGAVRGGAGRQIADFGFACNVAHPTSLSGLCGSPGPRPVPAMRARRSSTARRQGKR